MEKNLLISLRQCNNDDMIDVIEGIEQCFIEIDHWVSRYISI
jgi:hypothetical protein